MWNAGVGPAKDAYTIAENPQFLLKFGPGSGSVWVLLTRHITTIDDFRNNREYITIVAYENGGRKVYYPCEFKAVGRSYMIDIIFPCQMSRNLFTRGPELTAPITCARSDRIPVERRRKY